LDQRAGRAAGNTLRRAYVYNVQGQFQGSINAKGRLTLPARLNKAIQAHDCVSDREKPAIVFTYYDGSLQGYTVEYWRRLEKKLSEHSLLAKKTRSFVLGFIATANEVSVDKLGRLQVPEYLRKRAGLDRDVIILSYVSQIEIWDRAAFEARQQHEEEEMDLEDFLGGMAIPLGDEVE